MGLDLCFVAFSIAPLLPPPRAACCRLPLRESPLASSPSGIIHQRQKLGFFPSSSCVSAAAGAGGGEAPADLHCGEDPLIGLSRPASVASGFEVALDLKMGDGRADVVDDVAMPDAKLERETGDVQWLLGKLEGLPRKTVAAMSFALEARVRQKRKARK
jgi:hypothetical protein